MTIVDVDDSQQSQEQKERHLLYDGLIIQKSFPSCLNRIGFQIPFFGVFLFLHE
jgi:hypothetical protein